MPLANFGSLILEHLVFLAHLAYFHIAFAHMDAGLLIGLYCISKVVARRPEDLDPPPSPTEENQPPFFPTPPPPHPAVRPPFIQLSPYVASAPWGYLAPTDRDQTLRGRGSDMSLNNVVATSDKQIDNRKVSLKRRIACYQWTFFTMTMSTGGIANVLHSLRWNSTWINSIGIFFCLLNITLFTINCVCLSIRFYIQPNSFINSFTDQVESLFIPSFFVSIAIIMINICDYGIPRTGIWLLRTMEIMFWVYVAMSVIASSGIYLILWSTLVFPIHTMTPTWIFPAYPLLLAAPFAANLIASAEASKRPLALNVTAIALGATTIQGTGCLIAFMISSAFIYRLMTQKLPRDMQRPGVFMSIGPFGFTAGGIAHLGSQATSIIPPDFVGTENAVSIVKILSILVGLWFYGLSLWFFIVSVGSLWKYVRVGSSMPFQMTWWSFVFPNTALATATSILGRIFDNRGLEIFGGVMAVALIIVWIGVFTTMLWCLKERKLLWPKENT